MKILNNFKYFYLTLPVPFSFCCEKSAIKILHQNIHVERCSIREIPIKTTMSYHYPLMRMSEIKMSNHTTCLQFCFV